MFLSTLYFFEIKTAQLTGHFPGQAAAKMWQDIHR